MLAVSQGYSPKKSIDNVEWLNSANVLLMNLYIQWAKFDSLFLRDSSTLPAVLIGNIITSVIANHHIQFAHARSHLS